MIINIENSSIYQKTSRYIVNLIRSQVTRVTHENQPYFYTCNIQMETESKKIVHLPEFQKKIGINLYYKMLMQANQRWPYKWQDISCLWTHRFNIIQMSVLLKSGYRLNIIPIKFYQDIFVHVDKFILNFIVRRTRSTKTNLKKNKGGIKSIWS